jgi:hypothetical protein
MNWWHTSNSFNDGQGNKFNMKDLKKAFEEISKYRSKLNEDLYRYKDDWYYEDDLIVKYGKRKWERMKFENGQKEMAFCLWKDYSYEYGIN